MARRAVQVGINNYKSISDLNGCLNDVTNMRGIFKGLLGFTNEEIRVLTDERATKANILDRLNWLVKGAKSGDYLIFHYSGHGSQIRDREGDELSDSLDELICPWDMDWGGTYITDDDLNRIFTTLPAGVLLEVYLDSCNSGTGLRVLDLGRPSELGPPHPTFNRYIEPPLDLLARFEGEEDQLKRKKLFQGAARAPVHHILWAGCMDNQTCADAFIDGSYNGAFSYYFCKVMRETGNRMSRAEVLSRVRSLLKKGNYSQIPQLETEATTRSARIAGLGEGSAGRDTGTAKKKRA